MDSREAHIWKRHSKADLRSSLQEVDDSVSSRAVAPLGFTELFTELHTQVSG